LGHILSVLLILIGLGLILRGKYSWWDGWSNSKKNLEQYRKELQKKSNTGSDDNPGY
jgi:hypothetical protein